MDAVERRGLAILVSSQARPSLPPAFQVARAVSRLSPGLLRSFSVKSISCWMSASGALKPLGDGLGAALRRRAAWRAPPREKAHDPLLRLDDPAFPLGKLDAQGLGETSDHVEDKRIALRLPRGGFLFLFILDGDVILIGSAAPAGADSPLVALKRPEEEGRQTRVLLEAPAAPLRALASACRAPVPARCDPPPPRPSPGTRRASPRAHRRSRPSL
jgi:hypothetical protein